MSQPELLKKVINTLEQNGIEYMLTGSTHASSFWRQSGVCFG
jgi:hypothetical protein